MYQKKYSLPMSIQRVIERVTKKTKKRVFFASMKPKYYRDGKKHTDEGDSTYW